MVRSWKKVHATAYDQSQKRPYRCAFLCSSTCTAPKTKEWAKEDSDDDAFFHDCRWGRSEQRLRRISWSSLSTSSSIIAYEMIIGCLQPSFFCFRCWRRGCCRHKLIPLRYGLESHLLWWTFFLLEWWVIPFSLTMMGRWQAKVHCKWSTGMIAFSCYCSAILIMLMFFRQLIIRLLALTVEQFWL